MLSIKWTWLLYCRHQHQRAVSPSYLDRQHEFPSLRYLQSDKWLDIPNWVISPHKIWDNHFLGLPFSLLRPSILIVSTYLMGISVGLLRPCPYHLSLLSLNLFVIGATPNLLQTNSFLSLSFLVSIYLNILILAVLNFWTCCFSII